VKAASPPPAGVLFVGEMYRISWQRRLEEEEEVLEEVMRRSEWKVMTRCWEDEEEEDLPVESSSVCFRVSPDQSDSGAARPAQVWLRQSAGCFSFRLNQQVPEFSDQ